MRAAPPAAPRLEAPGLVALGWWPSLRLPRGAASCAVSVGRQRAEAEELRRQLEASSSAVTAALKEEYAKEKEERERRHQVCRCCPPLTPLG